jgi:hypothetical protein
MARFTFYKRIVNVGDRIQTANNKKIKQAVKPNHWHTFYLNISLNHWHVPDFSYATYWLIGIVVLGTTNDDLCDEGHGKTTSSVSETMTS